LCVTIYSHTVLYQAGTATTKKERVFKGRSRINTATTVIFNYTERKGKRIQKLSLIKTVLSWDALTPSLSACILLTLFDRHRFCVDNSASLFFFMLLVA